MFLAFSSVNSTFGGSGVGAYSASNRFLELLTHEMRRRGQSPSLVYRLEHVGRGGDEPGLPAQGAGAQPRVPADRASTRGSIRSGSCSAGRRSRSWSALKGPTRICAARSRATGWKSSTWSGYFTTRGEPPAPDRLLALEVRDQFQRQESLRVRPNCRSCRGLESGAIDRDRLSRLVGQGEASARYPTARRTELERQLARLWQEVFQVPRVSIHDNFFEMGGHSLLAAQLMARVAATLSVDLPLSSLFSDPTVAGPGWAVEDYRRDGSTADSELDLRAEAELPASIQPGPLPCPIGRPGRLTFC